MSESVRGEQRREGKRKGALNKGDDERKAGPWSVRGREGRVRGRRVCMCALLTTTPVAPSIHSAVWELNVHVCRVCMHLYVCLPASPLPYLVSQPCCFMHVAFDAPGSVSVFVVVVVDTSECLCVSTCVVWLPLTLPHAKEVQCGD